MVEFLAVANWTMHTTFRDQILRLLLDAQATGRGAADLCSIAAGLQQDCSRCCTDRTARRGVGSAST
ncbi:hypothetical protein RJ40_00845 [Methanofollis aquaemaris]|uniref:Uncharacterized protein n=1 Tax=Methanofollis aquaemaris TaxID=126734 RepID=A0A8A3S0G1_9EURY|nr:hypothetical protein [Methanofollis aquaemaris]QSZ66147.1 hypothetical protein RJ40_00845 [Methanofollis aquaemaris]